MIADIHTAKVLRRAVEIIERDGWIQGCFIGPGGERCATEAIAQAQVDLATPGRNIENDMRPLIAVRRYLTKAAVFPWNDKEGRTVEEVINMLLTVANLHDVEDKSAQLNEVAR